MSTSLSFSSEDARRDFAAAGLVRYEDFVNCTAGEVVARSGGSETRRWTINGAQSEVECFLKIYRFSGRRPRWALQGDKASVETANYRHLEKLGVDVPEVICHGSRGGLFLLRDAFILTHAVPNAVALDAFVDARWNARRSLAAKSEIDVTRRELLTVSATVAKRMHEGGFFHVDLQWRNILASQSADGAIRLFVIDSSRGGLREAGVRREHGRLRDLSSLAKDARTRMTRSEMLRWLRAYLGVHRLTTEHRLMIQTIERDRVLKDNSSRS